MRDRELAAVLGVALLFPKIALGQPAPTPTPAPAPAPAPAPRPPAPAPAPAPTAAGSSLPVVNANPPPSQAPPPASPPGYYVEQQPPPPPPPGQGQPPPGAPQVYEPPPPPGYGPYEPPPPPVPRHVAPRTALFLSARLGWFFPFGSAYASGVRDPVTGVVYLGSVPWTNFVSSGPAFEIDAGVRLGRNYNLFGFWERAQLMSSSKSEHLYGGQNGGDTDYWALALRATSDADSIGVLTELALGYRQARAKWEDGSELQMTGGVLEGRIGIGADLRLSPVFSLQPIVAVGVGSFDRMKRVAPGGASYDLIGPNDATASHGWVTFSVAGSADLFGAM